MRGFIQIYVISGNGSNKKQIAQFKSLGSSFFFLINTETRTQSSYDVKG